jgi:hypothetical protein
MEIGDFLKASTTWATPRGFTEIKELMDTDFFKNRWESGSDIEVLAALYAASRGPGVWRKTMAAGMITTRVGDIIPILLAGRVIYKKAYDDGKKLGMSDSQAKSHAEYTWGSLTEQTQQSSAWKDRTHWQRRGSAGQLFSMFSTSPRQYISTLGLEIERYIKLGDHLRAAKAAAIFGVVLPASFQLITDIFKHGILDKDDDEEYVSRYVSALLKSPLAGIYLVHYFTNDFIDLYLNDQNYFSDSLPIFSLKRDVANLIQGGYGWLHEDKDIEYLGNKIRKALPAVNQWLTFYENRMK